MSKAALKTSYSIHHQFESFFTGLQIQFDQKGEHFYCSHGSTVNKVSVGDGQVKDRITASDESDKVLRFAVTSDDELIIIAYHSGLIRKFNLQDHIIEREFKSIHSAPISWLEINSSNTFLATGSSDGTVKLWNLKNHYCAHNLKGVNGVVSCIRFHDSPHGNLLFCSAGDDSIHVFDIESSRRLTKLSTHCSTVTDMQITPDGQHLLTVGRDKIAVVWDISRSDGGSFGKSIRTIPIYESVESVVLLRSEIIKEILGTSFEEDRIFFATIGEEGSIKFWDTTTGSKICTQNEPPLSSDRNPNTSCLQLCSRPDHKQLCAVSSERDIFFYDLPRLELSQQLQGHIDEILSACWFSNNEYLAVACNSTDLKVVEISTSKTQHIKGHTDIILCVKSVPNHPMCVLSSSKDCTILIWKFNYGTLTPSLIYRAKGHTHAVHALAILSEERIFFSGGEDTTIKKWSFDDQRQQAARLLPSSDDSLIADQTIKAHDDRIDYIAISPNDQLVATASRDRTAKIFSTSELKMLATLKGHRRGVYSVQFSPVDRVVVTAGDITLRMWNLQDFTCVKTFQGHDCAVLNFTFLSSGLQLLSVASDGNMKLWDCKTNECMKTIDAHSGNTWTLSLTNDDDLVVTGGQDEKLIIWRDSTKEEREEKLTNMQTQVVQEQDFMNYMNKKKWRKALKMAIDLENQTKTLNVIKEILLEPDGTGALEEIILKTRLDKLNFIIECCIGWNATAKNTFTAQQVINIIVRRLDFEQLIQLPSLTSSMNQLRTLTEKSFSKYERLVQQAYFVDFLRYSKS